MAKKAPTKPFLAKKKTKFSLAQFPTSTDLLYENDDEYESYLKELRKQISKRQDLFYADGRHALLVVLQGMDTSGKDGIVKHVLSCINPQGLSVTSFGVPSEDEMKKDFLWRAHSKLPQRGRMAIFNRSHYEEVVTVRVQPEILKKQKLPAQPTKAFWEDRLEDIRNFESYLGHQGIHIIKIFLHLSKAEQKNRLLSRIDDREKNWKFDPNDVKARGLWSKYQSAYSEAIAATSTADAPWYVVPADDKKNARLIVAQLLLAHLEQLDLRTPPVPDEVARVLKKSRKQIAES